MNTGRMPLLACGPFLLALALAGCGDSSTPSATDSDQFNETSELLDSASGDLNGIDGNALGNTEDAAGNASEESR